MRDSDTNDKVRFFRVGDRISCVNGAWYVSTREGEEGPFDSREHAEQALARLLDGWATFAVFRAQQREREAARPARPEVDATIWDKQIGLN